MKAKVHRAAWLGYWEAAVYLLLTAAFTYISIQQGYKSVYFSELVYMTENMSRAISKDITTVSRYAIKADQIVELRECRSDILDAGLTFVLRDLELQNSVTNYDQWFIAVTRAKTYVSHALQCNPSDGDLWVRLAMINQTIGEEPGQLSRFMTTSVMLAPSELYAIRARFFVWDKASNITLALAQHALESDIYAVLAFASVDQVKEILATTSLDVRPHVSQMSEKLPPSRLALLKENSIKF